MVDGLFSFPNLESWWDEYLPVFSRLIFDTFVYLNVQTNIVLIGSLETKVRHLARYLRQIEYARSLQPMDLL